MGITLGVVLAIWTFDASLVMMGPLANLNSKEKLGYMSAAPVRSTSIAFFIHF